MKHNELSQKITALIEHIHTLQEIDMPQQARDQLQEAVCELQLAIDALDKDADESQAKAH
jgi:hypothetical protein